MPARDIYHDTVIHALQADGWNITHDPLRLRWGKKSLYIDLGAEHMLAAEKHGTRIAVEIKSFVGLSLMADLQQALGQYILYHDLLATIEPERLLYVALPAEAYKALFTDSFGEILVANQRIRLLVFDPEMEEIIQWTH